MRLSIQRDRFLQIVLITLFAVSIAQLVFWVLDEAHYTTAVVERVEDLYAADARAANRLFAAGVSDDELTALFPHVRRGAATDAAGAFHVEPAALAALREGRHSRLNRFGWEGTFFLVVLLAGMGVLYQALRRDADLRKRQQNFLAAVTHEFKSPLASMRLSAETLALRDPAAPKRAELVRRLLDDLERLETMVFNILDTARIEEKQVDLAAERVALDQAIAQILPPFEARAQASGVRLELDVAADAHVHADPHAVRSVLLNLLDNALKATSDGDSVRVSARRDGARVVLEVADDGAGFDPREARRLFDKFYRTGDEMRRRTRGSGLGLYLVARLVESGGGRVEAHSEGLGRGARFRVTWPAATEAAA